MKAFRLSFVIFFLGLGLAYYWAGPRGLLVALMLCIMEISLSFDNAVVNATILRHMNKVWQQRFLTWGILIAVFGMRLVFPIVIVAVVAKIGVIETARLAIQFPDQYAYYLTQSHISISAFGGMFLMMVFLGFILDDNKDIHWVRIIEEKLSKAGKLDSIATVTAIGILLFAQSFLPEAARATALFSGSMGIVIYVLINSITKLIAGETHFAPSGQMAKTGLMNFIYLEVLDASFSFDGVIGAFAITKDVIIIMLGLAIGAMFVRSMTIFLVHKGTLQTYRYLEHGAHYAIGALAIIMLVGMKVHVYELITGLVGVVLIGLSLISSIRHNKNYPNI